MSAKEIIEAGKAVLGIEFGSTRIKAVLIDDKTILSPKARSAGKTNKLTASGHTAST